MKTVGYFTLIGMVLLLTNISQAALTKGFLESLEKSLVQSADENILGMGKMMRSLDEAQLTRYADGIEKGSLSEIDTIAKLRKIFDGNELPELTNQVKALTGVERHTLITLLEDSKRIFQTGIEKGIPQETILSAIQKGGNDAIHGIRIMKSSDGVADCIRGIDKYGEQFIAFAKQGDEGAVRTLMKHIDDVPSHSIDDILKNPTKYFNANGQSLHTFDKIITNSRKTLKNTAKTRLIVAAIGTIVWACCPDFVFDAVEFIMGKPIADFLRYFQVWMRWGILIVIISIIVYFLLPFLMPVFFSLLKLFLRLVRKIPGKIGQKTAQYLDSLTVGEKSIFGGKGLKANNVKRDGISIGLLGSRRVGKSTFITMLCEKLGLIIEGASLEPATGKDQEKFNNIKDDVVHGKPTTGDPREIDLQLTWVFNKQGNQKTKLQLTDYPGENACANYDTSEFQGLVKHLQNVDGLFVIIDPTDLELRDDPNGNRQTNLQKEVIEKMFREDALDLNNTFKRALAILITKRDAIDRQWLEKQRELLAQNKRHQYTDEEFEKIVALSEKKADFSADNSKQLGHYIFDMLFPNLFENLKVKLSPSIIQNNSSKQWRHWLFSLLWASRLQEPQIEVFAISQLGFELGKQSNDARERGETKEFTTPLNLDNAQTNELDLHYPFQWMFDHIPNGWLNEINTRNVWFWNRRKIWKRFRGSPVIINDRNVSKWQGFILVCIFIILCISISWNADKRQKQSEMQQVENLLSRVIEKNNPSPTAAEYKEAIKKCRELSTHPYSSDLDIMQQMIDKREKQEEYEKDFNDTNLPKRVEAMFKWFNEYRTLPELGNNELKELDRYKELEKLKMIRYVDSSFKPTLHDYVENLCKNNDFDNAIFELKKGCEETKKLKNRSEIKSELDETVKDIKKSLDDVSDRQYEFIFAEKNKEIEKLLQEKDYQVALRIIDNFEIQKPNPEIQKRVQDRRNTILKEYWQYVQVDADKKCQNGLFEDALKFLDGFEQILNLGEYRNDAAEYRKKIPDKQANFAISKAKQLMNDGKDEAAWEILSPIQANLSNCEKETRESWCKTLASVNQQLMLYSAAIKVLEDHPNVDEKNQLLKTCWESWRDYIQKTIPQFINEKKYDEVRKEFCRYDGAKLTAPDDIRQTIDEFQKKYLPILDVSETIALSETKKEENTLNLMAGLRDKLNSVSEELKNDWLESLNRLYSELNKFEEAVKFLDKLKRDKTLSFDEEKIDRMIQGHQINNLDEVLHQAKKFEEEKQFDLAISVLLSFKNKIIQIEDESKRNEWWRTLNDLYTKANKNWDGLDFLSTLANDVNFKSNLNISPDDIEIKRREYITEIQNKFDDFVKNAKEDAAWRYIEQELRRNVDSDTKKQIDEFVNKKIESTFKEIDKKIDEFVNQSNYAAARKLISETRGILGSVVKIPVFNIEKQFDDREKMLEEKELVYKIKVIDPSKDYEDNNKRIETIRELYSTKLTDEQRKTLAKKQNDLWGNWEKRLYLDVYDAVTNKNYKVIKERTTNYLEDEPFSKKRSDERENRVRELKNWIEKFSEVKDYTVSKIRYKNFPEAHSWTQGWFSNYDPIFRITSGNNNSVTTRLQKNVSGEGSIQTFQNQKLKWKKDNVITIEIWQQNLDAAGYCIGVVKLNDEYALLSITLAGAYQKVILKDYAENGDFKNSNFQIGLSIEGLEEMPKLPEHKN